MHTDTQILAGHRQVGLALCSAPYTTQNLMLRTWDARLQKWVQEPSAGSATLARRNTQNRETCREK